MSVPLDTHVAIETPEHIVFRHRVAGPARRSLAYLVDLVVCYVVVILLAILIVLAAAGSAGVDDARSSVANAGTGLILVVLFCVQWVYFFVWEGLSGRSLGKIALGLRVVTTRARPIGFSAAALRNVLRAADALPIGYVVGVVAMLLTERFQRIGDLVAGTMVIVPDLAGSASPIRLFPPATAAELAELPHDVTLDADERAAFELFLRRRGRFGAAREQELAEMVTATLAARHGVRLKDAARTIALLYDRGANAGRVEAPPSSRDGSLPSSPSKAGARPWP